MITEAQEELASLYALDLLEGVELAAFERELTLQPELAALTRELREVSAAVALSAEQIDPPESLEREILRSVRTQDLPREFKPSPARIQAVRSFGWVPWAVAAALAVTCGVLQINLSRVRVQVRSADAEVLSLRSRVNAMDGERRMLQSRIAELETERSTLKTQVVSLQGRDPFNQLAAVALAPLPGSKDSGDAAAVWDPISQTGMLKAAALPPAGPDQDYQLWIVDPQYPNPVSAGLVTSVADGKTVRFKPDQPVAQVAALAVSLERKGGVPVREGPIVLLGKL